MSNFQASLSLPGSPFHRRYSRSSHNYTWRTNGIRTSQRRLRSSYLEAHESLPYMDDSRAVSPLGSLDTAPGYHRHSRQNSYSSHSSRITYNSHAELTNRGGSRELHWRRSGNERVTTWGNYINSWHTNNDLPLPSNGNNHIDKLATLKTILPEVVVDKQRHSVQFPVSSNPGRAIQIIFIVIRIIKYKYYLYCFTFSYHLHH